MAIRIVNPFYDSRSQLGFSWPALKNAILADMQAHPEKETYTVAELKAVALASGAITDINLLTTEMLNWLEFETDIFLRNV